MSTAAAHPGVEVDPGVDVDPFADITGQDDAVAQLRAAARTPVHAYLLVGPPGAGKRRAAMALAGELLATEALTAGDTEAVRRHRRLAAAEAHPDLTIIEREGPYITRDQARSVVSQSVRSPVEGARRVLVLTEFHLVVDAAPCCSRRSRSRRRPRCS
ncbi:MAG: ATP-binding protein [Acidimicrobiales bacterium]